MPFHEDHESFTIQPANNDPVWRYMDLARFLLLLESQALIFARTDLMEDKWEGALGFVTQKVLLTKDPDLAAMLNDPDTRAKIAQTIFLSCWHSSRTESAAMWAIYQREGRGVAIRSTWRNLTSSIVDDETVFGGLVNYVDYEQTYIRVGNVLNAFMHKRQSFAHEREVRLIAMPNLSGAPVPFVVPVRVDLERLIQKVYVSPASPGWIHDLIKSIIRRYNYRFEVVQSDLDRGPMG